MRNFVARLVVDKDVPIKDICMKMKDLPRKEHDGFFPIINSPYLTIGLNTQDY